MLERRWRFDYSIANANTRACQTALQPLPCSRLGIWRLHWNIDAAPEIGCGSQAQICYPCIGFVLNVAPGRKLIVHCIRNRERGVIVVEPMTRDEVPYHPTSALPIVVKVDQTLRCDSSWAADYDPPISFAPVVVMALLDRHSSQRRLYPGWVVFRWECSSRPRVADRHPASSAAELAPAVPSRRNDRSGLPT